MEILSFIFGGVFRIFPEIMKLWDKASERKHELHLLDKNMEHDRLRGEMALKQIAAEADVVLGKAEIEAIIAATKAQGKMSGIRWVDAINSLMRPLITFWWVIVLYTAALAVQFYGLLQFGESMATALLTVFGAQEKSIALSIIGFWFVDRAIRMKK
jgi:hypothetical protein